MIRISALQARFDMLPPAVRAGVWMSLSAFGYAASAAIVHHVTQRLPVFEAAFCRNLFGLVFMLPWLLRVGLGAMRTSRFRMHALRGLLSTANMWCLFGALSLAPVADVSAITFVMPIIGSVLAVLFLKERTSPAQWIAALVGFAGALIVIRPGMAGFEPGLLLAVGAAAAGATVAMLIKTLLRHDASDTVAAYLFLSHTVYGLIPALVVWTAPTFAEWGWLVLLGGMGAVVQRSFNRGMAAADATVALPFNFTRLIWAALFGWVFFAEFPDLWTWVGGTVIFLASVWLTRLSTRRSRGGAGATG